MKNATPKGGARSFPKDKPIHSKTRPKIQATPPMSARLQWLLWAAWWQGGARP